MPLFKPVVCATMLLLFFGKLHGQSTAYNYVVTYSPRVPVTAANTLPTATVANVNQTVQYFDALGRPMQTVQTKGSTTQRDVVQPMAYDQFDREPVMYLPYADSVNSANYGTYKTSAISDQASFYANPMSAKWNAPGVVTTQYPTASTLIEASPLNRTLEQGFPGDNWQLSGASGPTHPGHTIKTLYATNDASSLASGDGYWARQYAVVFSYPSGSYDFRNSLSTSGAYPANSLYVTVIKNENWSSSQSDTTLNTTQEYKDLFGRLILKRTVNYNTSTGTREVMSTYYVYDDYNNLIFVLPPNANPDVGTITQAQLDNYCYQYRYDGRNRMIYKKIPGKGWQFMVYNNLNQVITTQDSAQRMKKPQQFSYTKYDSQGRVIITGTYTIAADTVVGVDHWSALQSAANSQAVNWETKSSAGYSNVTIPTTGASALAVVYYDDYSGTSLPAKYKVTTGVSVMTRGLQTAAERSVLNNGNVLWSATYYDDLGRNIQTYKQHYLGGSSDLSSDNYDLAMSYYNFTDQVTTLTRQHYTKANTTTPKVAVTNSYTYDHMGRRLNVTEQITGLNGTPQTAVTLSAITYNQLGQVHSKGVGNNVQTINYSYNERGWLTAMTPQTNFTNGGNYAETISYNSPTGSASPQYNGNISQFIYNSPYMEASNGTHSPTATNTVTYAYDNLDRLTHSQSTLGATDETVTYDLEGNIGSMTRTGAGVNTGSFAYTYTSGTNRLANVKKSSVTFKQFTYDGNGNATSDSTTKTLTYNLLNLPITYKLNGAVMATYFYDVAGNKLRNVSTNYGTWDYVDGIVYKNENIDFIQTEEGQAALWADSLYHYTYYFKDYLGNTRASYVDSVGHPRIVQENDYYPFGLAVNTFDFSSGNRYLYNGKEEQYDLSSQYDYGARFYNPIIARWTTIDPLAEVSRRWSPYNYGEGNPIRNVDIDGMAVYEVFVGELAQDLFRQLQQQRKQRQEDKKKKNRYNAFVFQVGGSEVAAAQDQSEEDEDDVLKGVVKNTPKLETTALTKTSIASLFLNMLFLKGDNESQPNRMQRITNEIYEDLAKGDVAAAQEAINRWNSEPRNENDQIVFRYLSYAELKVAADNGYILLPVDAEGLFSRKYISNELYTSATQAMRKLALPNKPEYAIWTFEQYILKSKFPPLPGYYPEVQPKYKQPGGGHEATTGEKIPIFGGYKLDK